MSAFWQRAACTGVTLVALACVAAAHADGAVAPKTPAQAVAASLRSSMIKAFRRQAPQITIGAASCVLPSDGTVVHCSVHAAAPAARVSILYRVVARLHDDGTISWTAVTHRCDDSRTGKPIPC